MRIIFDLFPFVDDQPLARAQLTASLYKRSPAARMARTEYLVGDSSPTGGVRALCLRVTQTPAADASGESWSARLGGEQLDARRHL
jgi:hypothetical protein